MTGFATFRSSAILLSTAMAMLVVSAIGDRASAQIKPRILLVFDTSGSMVWNVGPGGADDSTHGDGSWDPWPDDRYCCPGSGNSRLYHAKEAVRQMVFATGDIEFALMKFVQEYITNPGTPGADVYYNGNQVAGALDRIVYQADNDCEWPPGSGDSVTFASYGDPDDIKWLCAEFPENGEDNRGAVLMWMDHHQYGINTDGTGTGTLDTAPVFEWSRAGDGFEQELRAIGATPIAGSLYAARDYLTQTYSDDYSADPETAKCRPYSVILMTDGSETCGGNPSAASQSIHTLTSLDWENKNVNLWVIGFAYQGDASALDTMAANGGTDFARIATNQSELSGVLYEIVNDSLLVETCDGTDEDCDGLIDEDFRPDRTYCNVGDACEFPHDGMEEEPEDILCARPSECACDGVDNNCDGETDEPPDGSGSWPIMENACGGCDPDVEGQEYCVSADEGRCEPGDLVCLPGDGYVCVGSVGPSEETCNGLDDDCDGETDEGGGEVCGPCGNGRWYCVGGILQCCGEGTTSDNCVSIMGPEVEDCNGEDDDCDGQTDEDLSGTTCGGCDADVPGQEYCEDPNEGICAQGVRLCTNGVWGDCEGGQGPEEEICNAQDDDCDGLTDEDIVGGSCGTCGDGNWYCIAGAEQCCSGVDLDGDCIPVQVPTFETCNGVDDDCNGITDENVPPRECMDEAYESLAGIGICNKGYQTCILGVWGNENPDSGEWEADYCRGQQLPVTETCNLADDDCDGDTDEDIVGETGCGPCGDGEEHCVNGILQCTGAREPEKEVCDGADNDCDTYTDENLSRPCMDDAYKDLDGIGICHSGIEMCKNGDWGYGETLETWVADVCGNQQLPQEEECDCLDNDCDGDVDEELGEPVGERCNACGVWECRDCELVCTGFGQPETCDGEDNNCNGLTDEGIQENCGGCVEDETTTDFEASLLADCLAAQEENSEIGAGEGECQVGVRFCDPDAEDDWGDCQGYMPPQQERCDNKDNDCDGVTDEDEDIALVNEQCSTAVGQCEAGWWHCVASGSGDKSLVCCASVTKDGECIPPIGPGVEVCNGLDDDCDGDIDEDLANAGQPCGSDVGICEPGSVECVCEGSGEDNCSMQCVGRKSGTEEECNGLDDDCDGLTDEDIPLGAACTNAPGGIPTGECDSGFEQCINGDWVCNGNEPTGERCDGLDNDCDNQTDENLTFECPEDSWCIEGECAPECLGEELSCLAGTRCVETVDASGTDINVCLTDVCGKGAENALECVDNPYWCDDGYKPLCKCSQARKKCISICEDITCPDGRTCVARTGMCQTIEDNCYATGCPDGEICKEGVCVDDPCPESCPEGQYCNADGECVTPCVDIDCPKLCFEGECQDRCDGVTCGEDEVCNEVTGECEMEGACDNVNCKFYQVCLGGECVEDPCLNIDCPNGFKCEHGSCNEYGHLNRDTDPDIPKDTDTSGNGDGNDTEHPGSDETSKGTGMKSVLATGAGGCMCNSAPGARTPRSIGMWLGLLGVCLLASRRRLFGTRSALFFWGILSGALILAGCNVEPFNLNGGEQGTSPGEKRDTASDSAPVEKTTDSSQCDTEEEENNCDGIDNDCDGETDEGIDLRENPNHCGACGNDCTTRYENAFGLCDNGTCTMGECAPFYQDVNDDPEDGCEYFCMQRSDSDRCNGVDLGDGSYEGMDDDCDGVTDEDANLEGDRYNCGRCGNVCGAPHAHPICVESECTFESCEENFYDLDGEEDNGCEYHCVRSDDGTERCNGADDDCDGLTDEDNPDGGAPCYSMTGGCEETTADEFVCKGRCSAGVEQCVGGRIECEGQVIPQPTESCNNVDDDCDGQTDELLSKTCRSEDSTYEETGACLQGSKTCRAGEWGECIGEILPTDERCDGVDNDCDGETDEDPVDVGQACGGSTNSDDPNEGACRQGVTACIASDVVCEGEVAATQEQCDDIDNDCDGFTDENITKVCGGCDPEIYDYCEARDQGLCEPGVKYCVDGEYGECVASIGPKDEVCDGFDNDCNGTVDLDENGAPVTGVACGSCGGFEHCLDGAMACCLYLDDYGKCVVPGSATGETCNGIDDDCDGITDNNLVQVLCDGDDADKCAEGVATCEDGIPGCSDDTGDNQELCDGLDNDCNGATDDGLTDAPAGWCNDACEAIGALNGASCAGATGWVCNYNCAASEAHEPDEVQCDAQNQVVSGETWCNGLDDDCDGLTDENLTATSSHCGVCGNDCFALVGGDEHVASLACVAGECLINECEEGYWDLDGNDDGWLDCEYGPCTRTGTEGTACDGIDNDCDGSTDNGAATVEVCDGLDNDCDGDTDEDLTPPDICNSRCPDLASHVVECHGASGWRCNYNCIGEPGGTVDCDGDDFTLADTESLCDGLDNNCNGSVDEGFLLWGTGAAIDARCTSEGVGGCARRGVVKCNSEQNGFECCAVDESAICDPEDVIPQNPEPLMTDEIGSIPDGVDDDCDGVADDGADGCISVAHIAGLEPEGDFDIFAYEASRRGSGEAPCSEAVDTPMPWTNVSFRDARAACLRLNTLESGCDYESPDENGPECWDLCSAEQWYYTCAYWDSANAPRRYPYGEEYVASNCNGVDYGADGVLGTGVTTDCNASWGTTDVVDLSGNVEEWTLDSRTVDSTNLRVVRGGSHKTVARGLTCNFNFFAADESVFQMDQLGFRCCRGGEPMTACAASLETMIGSPFDFEVPSESDRCCGSGWWGDNTSSNDWAFGKTASSLVGTDSCVFATVLNGNYSHNQTNDLHSPVFNFSACVGSAIGLSWDMWFNNGSDSDDTLTLQIRSSTDSGDNWSEWSTITTITDENLNWSNGFSETIIENVDSDTLYQLRFRFVADGSTNNLGAYLDNLMLEAL